MNETWADPAARVLRDIWDVMGWPTWLRRVYVLLFPLSLVVRLLLGLILSLGVVVPLIIADRLWKDWLILIWQGTHEGTDGWPVAVRQAYVLFFPLAAPIHLLLWIGVLTTLGAALWVRDWLWPECLKPIWTGVPAETEAEEWFE